MLLRAHTHTITHTQRGHRCITCKNINNRTTVITLRNKLIHPTNVKHMKTLNCFAHTHTHTHTHTHNHNHSYWHVETRNRACFEIESTVDPGMFTGRLKLPFVLSTKGISTWRHNIFIAVNLAVVYSSCKHSERNLTLT